MPIIHDGKNIVDRLHGGAPLVKKYHGDRLVWVKNIERRLPMEYQEVEYIESNGNSWIDTGFVFDSNTKVIVDVSLVHNKDGGTYILGGRKTYKDLDYVISLNDVGKTGHRNTLLNIYGSQSSATETYLVDNVQYRIFKDKNNLYSNGKLISTLDEEVFETPTTAYLFNVHISGTISAGNKPMVGKMFSCVIYDDDICVRNFVPCYRKSDHKAGMYDTISDTFFSSVTNADFFVGADVKCKKLEHCENLNGNYIDLRMKLKSSYKTKVDFQVPQTTTENRGVIFGTRGTNTDTLEYSLDKAYVLVNWTKINNTPVTVDIWNVYQGDGAKRRYSISEADRYKRLLVEFSDTAIKVNGATVKTNTALTEFETVKSACIFGGPLVGLNASQPSTEYVNAKIYSVEIKDKTDNLLFSLIPYQIGNTVGMLDTLSKVFFSGELVGKPFGTKQSRSR